MCQCTLFEQTPIVILFGARRDGIPLHYLVLSFVYIAQDQNLEFGKLGWDVQHVMVLRDEQRVAVCLYMCRIVYGQGIG